MLSSDIYEKYMTLMDCPYCHTKGGNYIAHNVHKIVQCGACGLYRISPRMESKGQISLIENHYKEANREALQEMNPFDAVSSCEKEIKVIGKVLPRVFSGGRVLDVGCRFGEFVAAMKNAGANVSGLEPGKDAVQLGVKYGLDLHLGRFELEDFPEKLKNKRFDLVCFRQSIYYVPDLEKGFDLLGRLLRPGGALYIQSTLGSSVFFEKTKRFAQRLGPFVSGIPTIDSLEYMIEKEGYSIQKKFWFHMDVFSLLGNESIGSTIFGKALNKFILMPYYQFTGRGDVIGVIALSKNT